MGKVIDIKQYLQTKVLDDDYVYFLRYINRKYPFPSTLPEFMNSFLYISLYFSDIVSSLLELEQSGQEDKYNIKHIKTTVSTYLQGVLKDLE